MRKSQLLSLLILLSSSTFLGASEGPPPTSLTLNSEGFFERQGLNVLVFNNWYDGNFSDAKISSVELIHHGKRIATNGDIRLSPTPEQWDPIPVFEKREIDSETNTVTATLGYPDHGFHYSIKVESEGPGFLVSIQLDEAVPEELHGKAGFNFEFLPSAFFGKGYLCDDKSGLIPLYPSSSMEQRPGERVEPLPLKTGQQIVLAPEDPERRVLIESRSGADLSIYDGRNQAQNGWFVVRSLLPSEQTGTVLQWYVEASTLPEWTRVPMIAYSQVGYHPSEDKTAIIELDAHDSPKTQASLWKVLADGSKVSVKMAALEDAGRYLRYHYYRFDFSDVTESGLYCITFGDQETGAFRIASDLYADVWQPTLDVFFPVQMDHMLVNEAYRVWHGASHLDDALQAPVNHEHFDLYGQGPTTDTSYAPGEHIPGLNVGGWYDAGDYDIRTQTQYAVVMNLVQLVEQFGVTRDQTSIDWQSKEVQLHQPDGKCDALQQIEHGTLALIAQHRAVGHAIPGIVAAHLHQYTHLGDGMTKTDNRIYDAKMGELETDGIYSGKFDDRWAFTTHTSALNYGSAAALAAASRVLKESNSALAAECIETAKSVWVYEQTHEPATFRVGNTTGGRLESEQLKAAVELWFATQDQSYLEVVASLIPKKIEPFAFQVSPFLRVYEDLGAEAQTQIRELAVALKSYLAPIESENPFGVPITRRGWAGNGAVVGYGLSQYLLHRTFPDLYDGSGVSRSLHYLYGCHPAHNLSFVSAVGANSKKVAYGSNRADFSFIAGGIVPGVLILNPDFPENKEDWPFFWGENEYVINLGSSYLLLVHAAADILTHPN